MNTPSEYNFTAIEKKWQNYWETNKTFKTPDENIHKYGVRYVW